MENRRKQDIKLYSRAYKDIDAIFSYIALEKMSPQTAKKQTDRIWMALKNLGAFPQSHQDLIDKRF